MQTRSSINRSNLFAMLTSLVSIATACGDGMPQIHNEIRNSDARLRSHLALSSDDSIATSIVTLSRERTSGFHRYETSRSAFGEYELQAFHLYYNGIKIEGADGKLLTKGNNVTYLSTSLPDSMNLASPHVSSFSLSPEEAKHIIETKLQRNLSESEALAEQVYVASKDGLSSAFAFEVEVNRFPTRVVVDASNGEILDFAPLKFHLDASARIYRENAVASQAEGLIDVKLTELLPDGNRLFGRFLTVSNCRGEVAGPECSQLAVGEGRSYAAIDYGSEAYDEVVAFYSISRSLDWYHTVSKSHGLGLEENPLRVYMRAKIIDSHGKETLDNATYVPGDVSRARPPRIEVGTGWEEGQNRRRGSIARLGKDADVLMHEFGHHIVFRGLKRGGKDAGQAGAMHEGFADYFTYAITGNNRLAESVTTDGAPLREGNKTQSIQQYAREGLTEVHFLGELWSSALWEARAELGHWKNDVAVLDKIVWDSIELLKSNASYYDAIAAMAIAAERFARENNRDPAPLKEAVFRAFAKRGYIWNPQGNGVLPAARVGTDSANLEQTQTPPPQPEVRADDDSGSCGVVSQHNAASVNRWIVVLGVFGPVCLTAFRRRRGSRSA